VTGDRDAALVLEREGGGEQVIPVSAFFRLPADFYRLETDALNFCRGRVLDVGAGTGVHARWLQERDFSVTAVDSESEAAAIMLASGLRDVRCSDVLSISGELYDTILVLGRSIGMAGDLVGLTMLLGKFHTLTPSDGQVLLSSLDIECTDDPILQGCARFARAAGRYPGETHFIEKFGVLRGSVVKWLYVDPRTLATSALDSAWDLEILHSEADGNYLARLRKLIRDAERVKDSCAATPAHNPGLNSAAGKGWNPPIWNLHPALNRGR
jgi:SAM-dependent methyltransferase